MARESWKRGCVCILKDRIGDVILIDVYENLAKGEALDMMQSAPAIEFDGKIVNKRLQRNGRQRAVIVIAGQAEGRHDPNRLNEQQRKSHPVHR